MKGMELPINMIVVILIAVLVLVSVGAFLAGNLGGGQSSIQLEGAFGQACTRLRQVQNCATTEFEVTGYTPPGQNPDTYRTQFFRDVCKAKGYTDPQECAIACGCPRPQ